MFNNLETRLGTDITIASFLHVEAPAAPVAFGHLAVLISLIRGTLLRADGAVDAILVQPELEGAKLRCQVHKESEGAQESTPGSIHK